MLKPLPNWSFELQSYTFDDVETKTCMIQLARIYKALQRIINEWNLYEESYNKELVEYNKEKSEEYATFTCEICCILTNYIEMIRTHLENKDVYIKGKLDELDTYVTGLLEQIIALNDKLTGNINNAMAELEESRVFHEEKINEFNSRVDIIINNLKYKVPARLRQLVIQPVFEEYFQPYDEYFGYQEKYIEEEEALQFNIYLKKEGVINE